jgi:methylated-DNA-[protein]-cysteine S-methyltransferase
MPRMAHPSFVGYAAVAAPWGPVHVAADDRAVLAVELLTPEPAFTAALERRLKRPVARAAGTRTSTLLDRAVDEVEEFLAGRRRSFDLPVGLDDRPTWDRAVLGAVAEISWGEVTSYGRVARRIGRPGAARAVGGAVGRNPIGLLVPCHRVIAGDGSIGGYGGSWYGTREQLLVIKADLLAREGVALPARLSD